MSFNPDVLISHAPEDRETAAFLASDLGRQGVNAAPAAAGDEQAVGRASALVALLSPASAGMGPVWSDADRAARAGKPLYVVRLGDVSGEAFAPMPVRHWTDAFGPQAQSNVARLAEQLRASAAPGGAPVHSAHGGVPHHPHAGHARSGGVPIWVPIVGGVVALVTLVGGGLYFAGVFDGGSSGYAKSAAPLDDDVSSNSTARTSPQLSSGAGAGGGRVAAGLAVGAAQLRSQLPLRDGPSTITEVEASGNTLTMYMTIDEDMEGTWSQLDSEMRRSICSGGFASLIRQGATAEVQLQDSAGSQHSVTISSC